MTGHLIHIGLPKTGSNYLRRWFAAHPDLAYLEGGIAGYRDVYQLARDSAADAADARYRVTSSEALSLPHIHAGDWGADLSAGDRVDAPRNQAQACARLAALFPNAHILIVTRGFRGMARSAISQFIRTGGDPAAIVARQKRDDQTGAPPPWDYDRLIALYGRSFAGRLIVLPYELLREDPLAFVTEIERALGIGHCPPPPEILNASLSGAELRWYPVLTRLVRSLPVGDRLRRRMMRTYLRASAANRLAPVIRLLDRLGPDAPVLPDLVTDAFVERCRGRAACLRDNPLYAPYADDYLL